MKIGKTVLKGCIPVLALAILVTFAVNAKSSSQDYDQLILGDFCFSPDGYGDTWHWRVEDVGDLKMYRITGFDHYYPGSVYSGSAHRVGKYFYAVINAGIESYSVHGVITVTLDLSTGTGTCDISWMNWDNTPNASFNNLPFSSVACPSTAADLKGIGTIAGSER